MREGPVVSVLLTSYNHASYVAQALESVAAQTFTDYELIVTDDASTDGSADVIREWLDRTGLPATFLANRSNIGICAVRNRALRLARGEFVCSLAGDDWFEPDRLERQAGLFATLPADVGLVYGDVRVRDAAGAQLEASYLDARLKGAPPPEGRILGALMGSHFLPTPGVMVRRSALDAVGGYDESLGFEDVDMWLRLADRFEARCLPVVVSNYRLLPTGMSQDPARRARAGRDALTVRLRYLGRDADLDALVARKVRRGAVRLAAHDRAFAVDALRRVQHVDDSARWRGTIALLSVPGSGRALGATLAVREALAAAAKRS